MQAYLAIVSAISVVAFVVAGWLNFDTYLNPWVWVWLTVVGAMYLHLCRIYAARGIMGAITLGTALVLITFWGWGLSPALLMICAWLLVKQTWAQRIRHITNQMLALVTAYHVFRNVTTFPVMAKDVPYVVGGVVTFMVINTLLVWVPRRLGVPISADAYYRNSVRPLLEEYFFDLALAVTAANAYGAGGIPAAAVTCVLLFSRYSSLQKSVRLQDERELSIRALITAMEARDQYTHGHSERVATLARDLALFMGLGTAQAAVIWEAGLLHDVGKIGTPDGILCKDGRLTDEEYLTIQRHSVYSEQILSSRPDWRHLAEVAGQHHESFNGKGYPRRLAGEAIRLEARILCVVDAYDAMTSNRSYRRSRPPEAALAEIAHHAGAQFDPFVARAFIRMMEERLAPSLEETGS
ncbi:MAG TPA: HD-GYP domain-containing protein [Symbiobacteriaceae bacterium]|nr:HD-GYP domain-containing protein [Symbiobacteriaceae bacterium]